MDRRCRPRNDRTHQPQNILFRKPFDQLLFGDTEMVAHSDTSTSCPPLQSALTRFDLHSASLQRHFQRSSGRGQYLNYTRRRLSRPTAEQNELSCVASRIDDMRKEESTHLSCGRLVSGWRCGNQKIAALVVTAPKPNHRYR